MRKKLFFLLQISSHSHSRKASFLGDSNFPHTVHAYKVGMTLQLYQNLYERYSSLALSYPEDRQRAISGLEKRLMDALKSTGGYGIFQSKDENKNYFHRGLLWQRSGAILERIKFRPEDQVPSWSWMAFDRGMRYMNVPLGDIEKANDTISPFEGIDPGRSYTDIYSGKIAELQAPIRTLATEMPEWLILDDPERKLAKPLKCVILGRSISQAKDGQRTHYALIISFLRVEKETEIYERAGVAYLSTAEILPEQDKKYVRIQ